MNKIHKNSKILVTGANGLVGHAVVSLLKKKGYHNIDAPTKNDVDFTRQSETESYFTKKKFDIVIHLAAKVGGIKANQDFPADFTYQNLQIACNVINSAYLSRVKKLLNLGSSCIYPRNAPQPIKEDYLLSSKLEKTNEGYAIAKIAGLKLCEYYNKQYGTNYMSFMPCNIYGEHDHFTDGANAHVLPALLPRFHQAMKNNDEKVVVWGTGKPMREFIYVQDVADALVYFMEHYDVSDIAEPFLNIGTGKEVSISHLAEILKRITKYKGKIEFNESLDGTMRKLLDVSKARRLGWKAKTNLIDGLKKTYVWYVRNENKTI
jgi:GDP-L-fucose synthase